MKKSDGIRRIICQRVKKRGAFRVSRKMIFTELGLGNCSWEQMKEVIEDLNNGRRVRVREEGGDLVFEPAKKRLLFSLTRQLTSVAASSF